MSERTILETGRKPDGGRFAVDRTDIARVLIVAAAFAFFYHTALVGLVRSWKHNPTYSFGFIIPLVSIYLAWGRRDRLAGVGVAPAPAFGFLALGSCVVLFLAAKAGGILVLQELSLYLALPALVILFFGTRIVRVLAFPLAYLVFMLPVWDFIIERLQFPFQLLSANIAGRILQFIGIPNHQHGILIEIPNLVIEIARACSGVNFLISIIAIGVPLAALYFDSWYRRVSLLVVSVFIAVLGNGLRAALIALFAYKGYSTNLHGPQHVFYGYFVSVLGLAVLFTGVFLFGKKTPFDATEKVPAEPGEDCGRSRPGRAWRLVVGTTVLFLVAGYAAHFQTVHATPLKRSLRSFPPKIGEFTGVDHPLALAVAAGNGADEELSRRYSDGSGRNYLLYVGYYAWQEQGKEVASYKIRALFRDSRKYKGASGDGTINAFVTSSGGKRQLAFYRLAIGGKTVTGVLGAKINTMIAGLLRIRTDGSIILITTDYDGDSDVQSELVRHSAFVTSAVSAIEQYLDASL